MLEDRLVCKYGGLVKHGKALSNTIVYSNDFGNDAGQRGTTCSRSGEARLVDCMKCEKCGHSFIQNVKHEAKKY